MDYLPLCSPMMAKIESSDQHFADPCPQPFTFALVLRRGGGDVTPWSAVASPVLEPAPVKFIIASHKLVEGADAHGQALNMLPRSLARTASLQSVYKTQYTGRPATTPRPLVTETIRCRSSHVGGPPAAGDRGHDAGRPLPTSSSSPPASSSVTRADASWAFRNAGAVHLERGEDGRWIVRWSLTPEVV